MSKSLQMSVLIGLPAVGVTALWIISTVQPALLSNRAWEPFYWILMAASILSLFASVWHFVASRRAPDALLCLLLNGVALIANIYGFSLIIQTAGARLG